VSDKHENETGFVEINGKPGGDCKVVEDNLEVGDSSGLRLADNESVAGVLEKHGKG
jgi:hypothetical protein